ncbi:MAG: transcriptional regulator [Acidimicrobiales bacterium]|nr:transcriptional regulator [Acidimicrobiales bacterium]
MSRPRTFDVADLRAAGLRVLHRQGWSAVTARSVAAELDVSPMALYRLAPDARHLRQMIADAAAPSSDAGPADRRLTTLLRSWAVGAYGHLGAYPGLATYVIVEWTELPAWLDVVEELLARAEARGVSGADAVATVNAVFAYVLVRAQLRDAARTAGVRELGPLRASPSRYPHIQANRLEFATRRTDRHFHFGLEALLGGLQ